MERIELFDNYINDKLTASEKSEFDARLRSDEAFASDFKVYLLTVRGICQEAEQDNIDFGIAMKGLTKDQLKEIIGKQSRSISRDDIIKSLRSEIVYGNPNRTELSGAAALDNIEDDDYEDSLENETETKEKEDKKSSDDSLRRITFVFFVIVILLILISIIL